MAAKTRGIKKRKSSPRTARKKLPKSTSRPALDRAAMGGGSVRTWSLSQEGSEDGGWDPAPSAAPLHPLGRAVIGLVLIVVAAGLVYSHGPFYALVMICFGILQVASAAGAA